MSFLFATPEAVAAAATDLANIGSTINEAHAAAAALTTGLIPAARDEVSAAIAGLFGTYAHDYQALAAEFAELHDRFAQAVTASAGSYLAAEGANVTALLQTAQQNLGSLLTGGGTGSPVAAIAAGGSSAVTSLATSVETTVVLGYTGASYPPTSFVNAVNSLFIQPNLTSASLYTKLYTPEQAYPFTGSRSMTADASVAAGVTQLYNWITSQAPSVANPIGVFGYSQGATIVSQVMPLLQAAGVPTSAVNFVLIGAPTPNGGVSERFAGLVLTAMGYSYDGSVPSNSFPTTIYTMEYDSNADFPRYPLDLLSDLNAITSQTHFYYPYLTATQVQNAIQLPTSGPTMTNYYMIPTNQLPLLGPLRTIPIIGNPIADLLQPDLTYLVNLGYGDPLYGWSTSPANINTPIGLFPPLKSFEELPGLLASGAGLGFHNFIGDFTGTGPNPVTLPTLSSIASSFAPSSGTGGSTSLTTNALTGLQAVEANPAVALADWVTDTAATISSTASGFYSLIQPTLDIVNAAVTSVPAYDISLFLNNLSNPVDAIGLPIAADMALYPILLGYEIDLL